MTIRGNIRKLGVRLEQPVQYRLPIGDTHIDMNALIGKHLSLSYTGEIHCIECGRKTKKSFSQGYCYPCFSTLAQCDSCIVKPETCHYFAGTCREPAWADAHCMQDHYVYLANSSGVKVGITRGTQIPTRWIDQGATQALPIFRVANRLISGRLEVVLKQRVADRTDWRKMLKGSADEVDLLAIRDELLDNLGADIEQVRTEQGETAVQALQEQLIRIDYPVQTYPIKVSSLNFDKTPDIQGQLQGIKGQYLILDCGVLNIRKFAGYQIAFQSD